MDTLPNDINQLKALLFKQSKVLEQLEIQNKQLAVLNADYTTEIARLTAQLDKLRRMTFGQSTEKVERKIQKVEKRLKELQDEAAVQGVAVTDPHVPPALRQSSARKPLPASLPREVHTLAPKVSTCPDCGGELKRLGEDISEQLELINTAFKVIQTKRPKLTCNCCDCIVQAPMPSKPIERSYAGTGLLARIVMAKYGEHTPL